MESFIKTDLHVFSILLCTIMLFADTMLSDKRMVQNRLFRGLIAVTAAMLVVDLLGIYSDGKQGMYVFSYIFETLLYFGTPLPPCIWALYVSYQLFQSVRRLRVEICAFAVVMLPNAVLSLSNPVNGLMFSISELNVYERGPFFAVLCASAFLPIVYSAALCIVFRKRISRQMFVPMLLFLVPPVAASLLQISFYGISVIWASITISIFIVYVTIQVRQHNVDHLTGVFNRRQFDNYLCARIRESKKGKNFSCIMLDIDNFKSINDTYGHVMGDKALVEAARLLRSCIRSEDFLSRFAGDEFVIILDMADRNVLDQTVARIRARADEYNKKASSPFQLDFSIGCEVYDGNMIASKEHLITRIDALMYQHKNQKKETLQS